MKSMRISLLAILFSVPILAWMAPLPAWAWGYGDRSHSGYGHYGHGYSGKNRQHHYQKYRYHRHGYRHYKHYGYRGHYRYYDRDRYDSAYNERYRGDAYTTTLTGGWDLLKTGRSGDALRSFGATAQTNPSNGLPKVGYALAAADLGRLDRGAWAMRRALHVDPDALHRVNVEAGLRSKVAHLIRQYEYSDLYKTGDEDAYFMVSALHYLIGDYEASKKGIERANRELHSTGNLSRLIEQGAGTPDRSGGKVDEGNY